MEQTNKTQENQDFKSFIVDKNGNRTEIPNPIVSSSEQVYQEDLLEQQMKQTENDLTIEIPVFIACKNPKLINQVNDILRTFGADNEFYKLFVISEDISEKLHETYWFNKLNEQEKERVKKQLADQTWKVQSFQLAEQVYEVLKQTGFECCDFEFNIGELKTAFANSNPKKHIKSEQIKQIIDILLVFGYAVKINEETSFKKLRFKMTLTNEFKSKHYQSCVDKITIQIESLQKQKQHYLEEINGLLIYNMTDHVTSNKSTKSIPTDH